MTDDKDTPQDAGATPAEEERVEPVDDEAEIEARLAGPWIDRTE